MNKRLTAVSAAAGGFISVMPRAPNHAPPLTAHNNAQTAGGCAKRSRA
ncbi:MAG: hypothetical protein LBD24_07670 [Spirochaetaceae bacterium]|nr:hypothetical protein [Spirochaetaceae bacterium]